MSATAFCSFKPVLLFDVSLLQVLTSRQCVPTAFGVPDVILNPPTIEMPSLATIKNANPTTKLNSAKPAVPL